MTFHIGQRPDRRLIGRLMFGALVALLSGLALVLSACGSDGDGGGGGNGVDLGRRQMTIQVDLPAGVSAATVQTALGEAPVTNGTAQVPAFDGHQLVVALAASGEPLLLGLLGGGDTTLDAASFAEALLFYASGAALVPGEEGAQEAALAAIADASGLADLTAAIEAALIANPNGFAEDGAYDAVVDQLEQAVAALEAAGNPGRGVLVQPLESKSGLTVNTTEGVNSIFLTNRYRRLGHATITRVSTFDESGTETASPAEIASFEVPSIQKLSSTTSTLVDIVYGKEAFEETSTPPVSLEAVPGAAKTRYRVLVVGPGSANGDYNQLNDAEVAKQLEVTQVFVVKELFLPMVLNMLIPASKLDDYLKFTGGGSLVKDVINILTIGAPKIWEAAADGDVKESLRLAWDVISRSSTTRSILLQKLLDVITDSAGPDVADAAFANGKKLLNAMKVVDTLLAGIDGTAAGLGVGLSNRADIWIIDVTPPKVRLDPASSVLPFNGEQKLTVSTPDIADSVPLVYKYTVSPTNLGTLRNARGTGAVIDSSENFIFFDAGDQEGEVTVTAEVLRVVNQNRVAVGSATATVKIQDGALTIAEAFSPVFLSDTITPGEQRHRQHFYVGYVFTDPDPGGTGPFFGEVVESTGGTAQYPWTVGYEKGFGRHNPPNQTAGDLFRANSKSGITATWGYDPFDLGDDEFVILVPLDQLDHYIPFRSAVDEAYYQEQLALLQARQAKMMEVVFKIVSGGTE